MCSRCVEVNFINAVHRLNRWIQLFSVACKQHPVIYTQVRDHGVHTLHSTLYLLHGSSSRLKFLGRHETNTHLCKDANTSIFQIYSKHIISITLNCLKIKCRYRLRSLGLIVYGVMMHYLPPYSIHLLNSI